MNLAIPAHGATDPRAPAKPSLAKPAAAAPKSATARQLPASAAQPLQSKTAKVVAARYVGISCVPYVRAVTGIDVKGNAVNWWANAAGQYERGNRAEPGAIMNFRATGRMRLGHVAVVTGVIDSRSVEIDHANWWGPGMSRGAVARGIPVIDVSDANDWSSVRVGLGHSGNFGSVYPTFGFIYPRPDRGTMYATAGYTTVGFATAATGVRRYEEVAEAPNAGGWRDAELLNRQLR